MAQAENEHGGRGGGGSIDNSFSRFEIGKVYSHRLFNLNLFCFIDSLDPDFKTFYCQNN